VFRNATEILFANSLPVSNLMLTRDNRSSDFWITDIQVNVTLWVPVILSNDCHHWYQIYKNKAEKKNSREKRTLSFSLFLRLPIIASTSVVLQIPPANNLLRPASPSIAATNQWNVTATSITFGYMAVKSSRDWKNASEKCNCNSNNERLNGTMLKVLVTEITKVKNSLQ
jgi:hypothetical protein